MDDIYVTAEVSLHQFFGISETEAKEIRNTVGYHRGVITDPVLYLRGLRDYVAHSGQTYEKIMYALYFTGYVHGVADCVISEHTQQERSE